MACLACLEGLSGWLEGWCWLGGRLAVESHTHDALGRSADYMYIYIQYIYIGGWGAETNREIISFRSCVRAQLYVRSEWISKTILLLFSFPFSPRMDSPLFPCEIRCSLSLDINEIKGIHVRSRESK